MKDDTISRAAAIDALKAMAVPRYKDPVCENMWERDRTLDNAIGVMRELPAAQPEIIWCKDCKYNPNPPEFGNAACVLFYGMTDQMGFCHHGERREQE